MPFPADCGFGRCWRRHQHVCACGLNEFVNWPQAELERLALQGDFMSEESGDAEYF